MARRYITHEEWLDLDDGAEFYVDDPYKKGVAHKIKVFFDYDDTSMYDEILKHGVRFSVEAPNAIDFITEEDAE